ncbi:hypothetical protein ACFL6S_23470 [Candidatus Poribacteria bacterium]
MKQVDDRSVGGQDEQAERDGIRPYSGNPMYWQYKGKPVLLLGGSDDDNLFQWTGSRLTDHLDLLRSVGGNCIRNVMSSRDETKPYTDDGCVYPFRKIGDKYDLDQWDKEYWNRLNTLLQETRDREIIVQLELWDIYTLASDGWLKQPWNPDNNINYRYDNTSLKTEFRFINPFFEAVPALNDDRILMRYQIKYVKRILEVCLQYNHVLYQIDNESPLPFQVSDYWARFIHSEAGTKGVYVCDSRRLHEPSEVYSALRDPQNPEISHPLSNPDLYNFCDFSQNGGEVGQKHYDNLIWYRSQVLKSVPRPINHTKIYEFIWPPMGSYRDRKAGSAQIAGERFWRTIFGGAASARNHRCRWRDGRRLGIGLSKDGQKNIKSMRMFTDTMNIFRMEPCNSLLTSRCENEAYALAESGKQFAVYFTGEGKRSVCIDLSSANCALTERWLDIDRSIWNNETAIRGGEDYILRAPSIGQWAVLLKRAS